MKLLKTCIQQPVIAIVISLLIMVLGIVGYRALQVRFLPRIQIPVVTIRTSYPGASANLVETQVSTAIENALISVDGIDYMTSRSYPGSSSVTVFFQLGGDFDAEVNNLRDKLSSVQANKTWPPTATRPAVNIGSNASPMLIYSLDDPNMSPNDLSNYAHRYIQPQLHQIPGVGSLDIGGASDYSLYVWLNSAKMTALNVTAADVTTALTADNIDFSGGSIMGPSRNYQVISDARLSDPQQFASIIIKSSPDGVVRLKDIGKVVLSGTSFDVPPLRVNGRDSMIIGVRPLQGVNPLTLVQSVQSHLAQLQASFPPGMKMTPMYNLADFLRATINDTFMAIVEAVLLVILVVLLFLGSWRSTLVPIVTIPVSLIGVLGVLNALNFSINIMSLLGIVLAIGLVVDDAIVVLENIHRYLERGESRYQAALHGVTELAPAVIAMSLTLVAVFAPLGLIHGFTAKLFQQFAFTLAGSVVLSALVALTLTPMMCSKLLHEGGHQGRFSIMVDAFFARLSSGYTRMLEMALRFRAMVLLSLLVVLTFGVGIFYGLHSELLPKEDAGVVTVVLRSPSNASVAYTDQYTKQVEAIIAKQPAVQGYWSQGSTTSSTITIYLKPWGQRYVTPQQVVAALNPQLAKITGVTASASVPEMVDDGTQSSDIDVNLMTMGDYASLASKIDTLTRELQAYPGLTDVHNNLKFDAQQYKVSLNRELASQLGVALPDIATTVQTMLGGNHITDVQSGTTSYAVRVRMQRKDLQDLSGLNKLYVRSTVGQNINNLVPLSSLVKVTPTVGQSSLAHYNRMRAGTVSGNVAPGYTEGQVIMHVQAVAQKLSSGAIKVGFSGRSHEFLQSQGSMLGIMVMAFVFIYLVLAAQFTSFIDPFIVLFAVPLSMVGGLLALKLGGSSFNLYAQIGVVTLVGLISKHGILITQFINQLRQQGKGLQESIVAGANIRLRPVLMTTAAMIMGTLPLAVATGPGSIGRHSIGLVIIGGLVCGTFFSLFVVPVAYYYLGRFKRVKLDADEDSAA